MEKLYFLALSYHLEVAERYIYSLKWGVKVHLCINNLKSYRFILIIFKFMHTFVAN